MDDSADFSLLSPVHARALELHQLGWEIDAIAADLDVDEDAVAPLLRIAQSKLAAIRTRKPGKFEPGPRNK